MSKSQGSSGGAINPKAGRRRRAPWGLILLSMALLVCALALYLYSSSNSPRTRREHDDIGNVNRATPAAATPTRTPAPAVGANTPR